VLLFKRKDSTDYASWSILSEGGSFGVICPEDNAGLPRQWLQRSMADLTLDCPGNLKILHAILTLLFKIDYLVQSSWWGRKYLSVQKVGVEKSPQNPITTKRVFPLQP